MNKSFIFGCSKERSPLCYWIKSPNIDNPIVNEYNEWKYRNSINIDAYWKLFGDNSLPVAVDPYIIPIKGIANKHSAFLTMIVNVANSTKDYSIFDNIIVRLVIKYKWSTYISIRFTRDFTFLCIWFALYMYNTLSFQEFIMTKPSNSQSLSLSGNMLLMTIILIFFIYFFYHEILQLVPLGGQSNRQSYDTTSNDHDNNADMDTHGHTTDDPTTTTGSSVQEDDDEKPIHWLTQLINDLQDYLTDMSNWFNIISYGLVCLTLCLQARLYYKKTMYYYHHDSNIDGEYVIDSDDMHRIRTVAAANLPLLVLNVMYYLGGFSVTGPFIRKLVGIFWGISTFLLLVALLIITFAGSFMLLLEQNSYSRVLLQVYTFLFGDFDMSVMYDAPTNPTLAVTLLALFLFIMCIVLLNLLVAIMDDIKGNIDSRIDAETFYAKAKFILDYERTLIDATTPSIQYHVKEIRQCHSIISNIFAYLWKQGSLYLCWDVITDKNEEIWFPTWIQLLAKSDHVFESCPDPFMDGDTSDDDNDSNNNKDANNGNNAAKAKLVNLPKKVEQLERKIDILQKMMEVMMDTTIVRWESNPDSSGHSSSTQRIARINNSHTLDSDVNGQQGGGGGGGGGNSGQSRSGGHNDKKKGGKNHDRKSRLSGWFW